MPNDMRDRLIELLTDNLPHCDNPLQYTYDEIVERIADHLIENGAILTPCKVGDKTFLLLEKLSDGYDIVESKCVRIIDNGYGKYYSMDFDCAAIGYTLEFDIYDFGKTVFLTREDAEKALREREGE